MADSSVKAARQSVPTDGSVNAARGILFIAAAKAYFMVAGYAIYFTLPRLLGSPASWGDYLLVIGLASVIDNVIVTGTIQGVSRFTAQSDDTVDAVKRAALRVQILLGGGIAFVYFATAPWIAAWERDVTLTEAYRLSAGIVLCYSFYSVFVGSLNGQRRFGHQAALDVTFATLRALLILGAAALGWGTLGAIGGFVAAAAIILVLSAGWVRMPRRGSGTFALGPIWRFMALLFIYHGALNLILRADLFLLKRFVAGLASSAADPAHVASTFAGYYGTAQSLAFLPYQAILAVAFVVFPLVSRATFEQDVATTQSYIRQTLRLSLVFVAGVGAVLMANPEAVINLPYPATYRPAGGALRILTGGMIFFSMFTIINTILNGAGRARDAIVGGLITLVITIGANWFLVPRAASGYDALSRAAWATAGSMAVGTTLCAVLLHRAFGAAISPLSVLRILLALAAALTVGHFIPEVSKLVTLGECVLIFVVYLVVLFALGELRREDTARFARLLRRRR